MEIASSSPLLNREIFDQVLCMDDGDDHEFSKSLIENFFEQAEETFVKMNAAM
jgi:osomolarity two-component system phosphorelay intermediate protein YPD1